jgi:hypothetical protein
MTQAPEEREREREYEAGMLDYQARNAVRDLIDRYGLQHARMLIAIYINDEADRPVRRQRREQH